MNYDSKPAGKGAAQLQSHRVGEWASGQWKLEVRLPLPACLYGAPRLHLVGYVDESGWITDELGPVRCPIPR